MTTYTWQLHAAAYRQLYLHFYFLAFACTYFQSQLQQQQLTGLYMRHIRSYAVHIRLLLHI